jgi:hypothetical protein
MIHSIRWSATAITLCTATLACGSETITGAPFRRAAAADTVAMAIAVAMADPEIRSGVRDALRASPYTAHRIRLREFLETPVGRRVSELATARSGPSSPTLTRLLAELPEMALVVPRTADRRSWTVGTDFVVAATTDNNRRPSVAFGVGGEPRDFRRYGAGALFLIEPAEGWYVRYRPQSPRPGLVIQDPDDGQTGGMLLRYDARGRLIDSAQFADILARPAVTGPDVQFDVSAEDTTYLDHFETNKDDGAGNNELKMQVDYYNNLGQLLAHNIATHGDVEQNQEYNWHIPIINARLRNQTTHRIHIDFYEEDLLWDDYWGMRDFHWNDRDEVRTVENGDDGAVLQVELDWESLPYVAPPPVVPGVSGPSYIAPNTQYSWSPVNVSGGTSPYTYEWYLDDEYMSTGSTFYASISEPSSVHYIRYHVYDQNGLMAYSVAHSVTTDNGSCPPEDPECEETFRVPSKASARPLGPRRPKPMTLPNPRGGSQSLLGLTAFSVRLGGR